ncbi:30S ribosomal protein S7 [bacterium]|jgi:small subunit ribosomal protein S7|nr:30S ribosomal protein S7 [bacterium]NBX71721.1 30S ribosomal protein S7 [bacterium]
MARRREAQKRITLPDQRFNDVDVTLFINHIMYDGKKDVARNIFYSSIDMIAAKFHLSDIDSLKVFHKALMNVMPDIEVKSRRVGGATYQVPIEVDRDRAKALAMRWILESARKRPGKSMIEKLTAEFIDAEDREGGGKGRGGAIKKKDDTHRMAEANRAFAHYRW